MTNILLEEPIKKLGFGFMRLPKNARDEFDLELVKKMVDIFMSAGFTYFDTAYVYQGSEQALHETLVKRYPRDKFTVASKMPLFDLKSADQLETIFTTSLSRVGIDYFDFYLIHSIDDSLYEKTEEFGVWKFVSDMKQKGRIRHIGFSYHGSPELLDKILAKHPETEFVQLQINYLDWDDDKVKSRELYETVRKYNKPIVIMEPVKGGMLAGEASPISAVFSEAEPKASTASWAIRFAASLEGVYAVLSGMNSIEQMNDNIATVDNLRPLSQKELEVIEKAKEALRNIPRVPCTKCAYCVENCPSKIKIPDIIALYNDYLMYKTTANSDFRFMHATMDSGKPSECVTCRTCEDHCPQHIGISDIMKETAKLFEK